MCARFPSFIALLVFIIWIPKPRFFQFPYSFYNFALIIKSANFFSFRISLPAHKCKSNAQTNFSLSFFSSCLGPCIREKLCRNRFSNSIEFDWFELSTNPKLFSFHSLIYSNSFFTFTHPLWYNFQNWHGLVPWTLTFFNIRSPVAYTRCHPSPCESMFAHPFLHLTYCDNCPECFLVHWFGAQLSFAYSCLRPSICILYMHGRTLFLPLSCPFDHMSDFNWLTFRSLFLSNKNVNEISFGRCDDWHPNQLGIQLFFYFFFKKNTYTHVHTFTECFYTVIIIIIN